MTLSYSHYYALLFSEFAGTTFDHQAEFVGHDRLDEVVQVTGINACVCIHGFFDG